MAKPTLNDLRILAAALPPSERVFGAEAADLLSAIAAVVTHGDEVLTAAQEGGNTGVADFYHQRAVDQAREAGADEPVRGAQPVDVAAPAAPAAAGIDYDKLAAAMVRAQRQQEQVTEPPAETHEGADVTQQRNDSQDVI